MQKEPQDDSIIAFDYQKADLWSPGYPVISTLPLQFHKNKARKNKERKHDFVADSIPIQIQSQT